MAGTEYHKIWSPFKRETEGARRGKLIVGEWALPEFELLAGLNWTWTEKVNGTNVRIEWNGHKVTIGGRTDDAQMPLILVRHLQALFTEEMMEQQFHGGAAVLYGEGYGARIAAGSGVYSPNPNFVLFDVNVAGWWLLPDTLETVAKQMGLDLVPTVHTGGIGEAIELVTGGTLKSRWGNFAPEGLVGKPPLGLTRRDGDRMLIKIKAKDFS